MYQYHIAVLGQKSRAVPILRFHFQFDIDISAFNISRCQYQSDISISLLIL